MITSILGGPVLAAVLATTAVAEGQMAVVIAGDADRNADAVAMSETLLGLGFDVTRLEQPDQDTLSATIAALDVADGPTAIYYAGSPVETAPFLNAAHDAPRFVFLDTCLTESTLEVPDNVVFAAPRAACAVDLTTSLLDVLTVPGLSTAQWDLGADLALTSTLSAPYVFRPPTSDVRLSADDYALLDTLSPAARDQMIQLWRDAGIVVDVAGGPVVGTVAPVTVARDTVQLVASVRPVETAPVLRPVTPTLAAGGQTAASEVAVIARPLTAPISLPPAGQGGLPTPSILVGFAIDDLPDAPQIPDEPVSGATFGTEDFAAREALRAQDEALFGGLLESGVFDPAPDDIARALQVELARINCYTSGIDGAWGPGSQRALAAFYEEAGLVPSGTAADLDSFRAVIASADIRCPDPAPQPVAQPAAQPRPQSQPAAQPTAAQSRRPAATPAPAPAPAAPASPRRSINQTGGTGVFR